jgi:hypothetical protein
MKSQPDFVLVNSENSGLDRLMFFVEIKFWSLDHQLEQAVKNLDDFDCRDVQDQPNMRNVIGQVCGYLCNNKREFRSDTSRNTFCTIPEE